MTGWHFSQLGITIMLTSFKLTVTFCEIPRLCACSYENFTPYDPTEQTQPASLRYIVVRDFVVYYE
jgi:hypothetical protein